MKNFRLSRGEGHDLSKKQIVAVLVVIAFVAYLSLKFTNSPSGSSSSVKEATTVTSTTKLIDPAELEADKKLLADLKTKFKYTYDEFDKKGWYENKSQVTNITYDKSILRVRVNNVGYAYLESQYYGDDWIFHTHVEVKIGDTVYQTEDIPTYDKNNAHSNTGGSVWEVVAYTADRDNGIMKAIAESGDAVIKVRFAGGEGHYDMTLSKRDQQAIKDAYQLSQLIIKVGDTGATK